MLNPLCNLLPMLLIAAGCLTPCLATADDKLKIISHQVGRSLFAEDSIRRTFEIRCSSEQSFSGIAIWSFSLRGRTIARGESAIQADSAQPATVTIPLTTPPIHQGLVFACQLQIDLVEQAGGEPLAELTQTLHVWSRDAFSHRQQWLNSLSIRLFDPQQQSTRAFRSANIPFEPVEKLSAMDRCKSGWIVVGAGTHFDQHPRLATHLVEAAARGVNVLCLAPNPRSGSAKGASFAIPLEPKTYTVQLLSLRRSDVIEEFDKRFDSTHWQPSEDFRQGGMSLIATSADLQAQYGLMPQAWPWLEIVYRPRALPAGDANVGRLIVSSFPIIEHWDDHPTPRYLLAEILAR